MTDDLTRRLRETRPTANGTDALVRSTAETADRAGLVDVAYGIIETPVGPVIAGVTERGLAMLEYVREDDVGGPLAELAARISPRVLEVPARVAEVVRQLDAYFAAERRDFDLPIDWALVRGDFARAVLQATAGIPYGEVRTYAEVAGAAGNRRASRAAGNALGSNPVPIVVPCHRVVRTGGGLGGYTGGLDIKRHLLALEGARPV